MELKDEEKKEEEKMKSEISSDILFATFEFLRQQHCHNILKKIVPNMEI